MLQPWRERRVSGGSQMLAFRDGRNILMLTDSYHSHSARIVLVCLAWASLACTSIGSAQQQIFNDPSVWLEIEDEMLAEINFLRSQPTQYAEQVLVPMIATLTRRPKDKELPYESSLVRLSEHPIDYIEIAEGDSDEDAVAVIREAIDALKASPGLQELKRNEPLDRAARWFSRDFMDGGEQREPHIDSLGRQPGQRISAFGATKNGIADWDRLKAKFESEGQVKILVFKQQEDYFWFDLLEGGAYRYRSISSELGKFVEQHGIATTIPRLGHDGHELAVTVDPMKRQLKHEDATIDYPMNISGYRENVVWGPWSRNLAARGLVCWWILDPGIPYRGHRKTLLEPSLRYCGIGCIWSRSKGFVATFDATTEAIIAKHQ